MTRSTPGRCARAPRRHSGFCGRTWRRSSSSPTATCRSTACARRCASDPTACDPGARRDYVQIHELTVDQARELAAQIAAENPASPNQLTLPPNLAGTVALQFWGGGTVIFDQFGRVKLHQRKDLNDWVRQSRRLDYLARQGRFDSRGRLGFSIGAALGMAFAGPALARPPGRGGMVMAPVARCDTTTAATRTDTTRRINPNLEPNPPQRKPNPQAAAAIGWRRYR